MLERHDKNTTTKTQITLSFLASDQSDQKGQLVVGLLHSFNCTVSSQDKSHIHSFFTPSQNASDYKLGDPFCSAGPQEKLYNSKTNAVEKQGEDLGNK